jgi:cell division protein FtsI (penicillin-binding protein 3)
LNELGIKNAATPETPVKITEGKMPDVIDMGARDAIYLLERQGVKVQLHGMGRVKRQSIAAGSELKQGMVCVLELQ